eukprot:GEMP01021896.1.p1 GENE.GEMP01021896.1~~GEMP01021896.1.p1  ORF type:complete len:570 (+),score=135.42 GEMP01021896.1:41-1711(+)
MATVEVRYLGGVSTSLSNCENVGDIMFHLAKLHSRFASSIAVVCPDTGKDLTDNLSQTPPPIAQVVVKPAEKELREKDEFILTLCIHGEHEDDETCVRAYQMLQESYPGDDAKYILVGVLCSAAAGHTQSQEKILRTLIRAGVDGTNALVHATSQECEKSVKALLSAGVPVDSEDTDGWTALMVTSQRGRTNMTKTLLSLGANVHHVSQTRRTALILASVMGQGGVVEILLSHGAQIDHICASGFTAVDMASAEGHSDVVEILLSHGANVNRAHTHKDGSVALAIAIAHGHTGIEKMLRSHGAVDPHRGEREDTLKGKSRKTKKFADKKGVKKSRGNGFGAKSKAKKKGRSDTPTAKKVKKSACKKVDQSHGSGSGAKSKTKKKGRPDTPTTKKMKKGSSKKCSNKSPGNHPEGKSKAQKGVVSAGNKLKKCTDKKGDKKSRGDSSERVDGRAGKSKETNKVRQGRSPGNKAAKGTGKKVDKKSCSASSAGFGDVSASKSTGGTKVRPGATGGKNVKKGTDKKNRGHGNGSKRNSHGGQHKGAIALSGVAIVIEVV